MKAVENKIKIKNIVSGFENKEEEGVFGLDGTLSIRPSYQREFVYNGKQQEAVIQSILSNMPLNVMYWVKNSEDSYEVLDGQQRTISICKFVEDSFSIKTDLGQKYFSNLSEEDKEAILNYEIIIYICEGTEEEKLKWFRVINIAGEKLTEQELRNSVYKGPWLSDAKKYFSRSNCPAYTIGSKLMKGSPIRQDYLETVIDWASNGSSIEEYMAQHQLDKDAKPLWEYYQKVIRWVNCTFSNLREKEMKGVSWGLLYNHFGKEYFDPEEVEKEISSLMKNEDVTKKSGIYTYFFTRDPKYLNLRVFDPKTKRQVYENQQGVCVCCGEKFDIKEMEADHITPWSKGGKTEVGNCQMLCKPCNRTKSNK